MKKMWLVLLVSTFIFWTISQFKTSMISLPKEAQHNTFGELPVVEVVDDGNFYENDGEEEENRKQILKKALEMKNEADEDYLDCLETAEKKCDERIIKCLKPRAKKCEEKYLEKLMLIEKKEKVSIPLWTCAMFFASEALEKTGVTLPDCWQVR